MSIWTHVVGAFRIDGGPILSSRLSQIERVLGPISSFEHPTGCKLPLGSEGSLQYRIVEYDTGLPWAIVSVWGDLRDYDDIEEIKRWWAETLSSFPLIRDGILRVQVEGLKPVVLQNEDSPHDPR